MTAALLAMVAGAVATHAASVLWRRPARARALIPVPVPRARLRSVEEPTRSWLPLLMQFVTAGRSRAAATAQDAQDLKERSGIEHAIEEASTLWGSRQRIAKQSKDAVADAAKEWRSTAADLADDASSRLRADTQAATALLQKAGQHALVEVRRSAAEQPLGTLAAAAGIAFALTLLAGRR